MNLTPEQFEALPNPPFKPARDMMLCLRIGSTSGLIELPSEFVDSSQMCRVLITGDGLYDDCGQWRTSPYGRGDLIMITPRDGYPMTIDGAKYWIAEQKEVIGEILDETSVVTGRELP